MGSSFVESDGHGFWMRDGTLQLWLRLMALNMDVDRGDDDPAVHLRNHWLLESRLGLNGAMTPGLDRLVGDERLKMATVKSIQSLLNHLRRVLKLDANTLNLLGFDGSIIFLEDQEAGKLVEVGEAFLKLITGEITTGPESTAFMPGT